MSSIDQPFVINLVLSFVVGSVWITAITVIAERFGSKIGGFIGGLPSTIVIALLFIGITQSAQEASQAAVMIPLVMGVNGIFIVIYLATVRRGVGWGLFSAVVFWFITTGLIVFAGLDDLRTSIIGWLIMLVVIFYITEHVMLIDSRKGLKVPYTMQRILGRGVVSGVIISMSVLVSRLAGPVIGGIYSTFPVIFSSTLYITYRTGGADFSRAVAKALTLSGMINVGVYAIVGHFAYQHTGLLFGTLISILVSGFSASFSYRIIQRLTR